MNVLLRKLRAIQNCILILVKFSDNKFIELIFLKITTVHCSNCINFFRLQESSTINSGAFKHSNDGPMISQTVRSR